MTHDLVLEGKAFIHHSFQECCIGIDDGKITAIKKILTGEKRYRFPQKLLLPAGIDIHVHFRDPGMTQKETFYTGSVAAAFGGISCIFDMPNTRPPTITPKALLEKQQLANQKSIVDFGLYAGLSENILSKDELSVTLGKNCHGFKLFLGETTNSFTIPSESIPSLFTKIKSVRKPILVHAEDNACLNQHKKVETSLLDHHLARPPQCETKAINMIQSIAESVGTPVHFCHISSSEATSALHQNSQYITYGITPHHSLLHINSDKHPQSWSKVNPPLRPKKDQQQVLEIVKKGNVFLLESDHAPHTLKEKDQEFQDVPSGIPGVETIYPLFLGLAEKQQIPYWKVISLLAEKPSQLFHLSKGFIAPNYDADIVVVDKRKLHNIHSERLHSKSRWTPFEGFPAMFPSTVFIRGNPVIQDFEQQVSAGFGSMIPLQNK